MPRGRDTAVFSIYIYGYRQRRVHISHIGQVHPLPGTHQRNWFTVDVEKGVRGGANVGRQIYHAQDSVSAKEIVAIKCIIWMLNDNSVSVSISVNKVLKFNLMYFFLAHFSSRYCFRGNDWSKTKRSQTRCSCLSFHIIL